MTKEEGLIVAMALCVIAIVLLYLHLSIRSMEQHLDRLDSRTYECVSEMLFRLEQDQRRELGRKIDAMQEHLGVMTVVQPQRTTIVKKGNAP